MSLYFMYNSFMKVRNGYLVYHQRKFFSIMIDSSMTDYEPIEDFGVTPLCIILGEDPTVLHQLRNSYPHFVNPDNIKYLTIETDLHSLMVKTRIPWIGKADRIVPYIFEIEEIKKKKKLPIKSSDYTEIFRMKTYQRYFQNFLETIEQKEGSPVREIIDLLGSKYSFINKIYQDFVEYYFWTGVNDFRVLHEYLWNVVHNEFVIKLPYRTRMYWRTGENTPDYIEYIKHEDKKRK